MKDGFNVNTVLPFRVNCPHIVPPGTSGTSQIFTPVVRLKVFAPLPFEFVLIATVPADVAIHTTNMLSCMMAKLLGGPTESEVAVAFAG